VIVTTIDTQLHLQSLKVLSGLPLSPGQVVFTGHISDEDLRLLYTACEVFAFPSLHEGFGLPIVEAMACGAAVVASNSSSMPEAVGRSDALFDPNKTESIAQKLLEVLTSPAFALDLRAHGKAQVQRFTWERSAAVAWQAFQQLASQQALTSRLQIRSARAKPRLAYFSPLPPTRSGIADYSAELLPALAQHYEVEAIIDGERVEDDWIATHVPLRNVAWFEDNASRFDRVLYHMGNSAFHQYMLPLIERWPGVVVLHDFYLSGLFHYIGRTRDPGQWFRRLYDAHGLAAVRRYPKIEQSEIAAWEFPCSLPVVDNALGIIVHSNHAVGMLRDLTGGRVGGSVVKVPFPRGTPGSRDRSEARARLRIDEGEFLVCSFGHLASTKLNHRLIDAWQLSRIGGRRASRLVFVGDLSGNPYAAQVWAQIRNGGQIDVTGYAQLSLYRDYLAACDVAVQLRTESRGETSASVFDCLAHGAPVIVNDHGSMAELPEDVALKIPDAFSDEDLAGALDQLANDRGLRSVLAQRGLEFARGEGNPVGVAERMRDAIENFQHTKNGRLARLIGAVASTDRLGEPDLVAAARAMGANRRSLRDHQLLLDVTNLAGERDKVDPRALAAKLIDQLTRTPASHRVEPVTAHGELRYARSFAARHFNLPAFGDDTPVDPMEGDRFLVVDVRPELPVDIFDLFRRRNVGILCVVQDCPPLADSTRVPSPAAKALTGWIEIVGRHADVALCTSRSVADDLYEWLNLVRPQRTSPLSIAVFSLGSDSRGEDGDQEPEVKGRGDDVPTPWSGRANGLLFAMEPQNAYRVWQVKETSR
jgi:glycosyltransferase involved in cell wall biosynthesis